MAEQEKRLLMTAANGMQVWIPESRVEAWQRAQAAQKRDPSKGARQRNALTSKIVSAMQSSPTSAEKK